MVRGREGEVAQSHGSSRHLTAMTPILPMTQASLRAARVKAQALVVLMLRMVVVATREEADGGQRAKGQTITT
jgi:hypothetical protein